MYVAGAEQRRLLPLVEHGLGHLQHSLSMRNIRENESTSLSRDQEFAAE